jgi:hypothetical protein
MCGRCEANCKANSQVGEPEDPLFRQTSDANRTNDTKSLAGSPIRPNKDAGRDVFNNVPIRLDEQPDRRPGAGPEPMRLTTVT